MMSLFDNVRLRLGAAKSVRDRSRARRGLPSDSEFLPAALALVETPPSIAARRLMWVCALFVVLVLTGSIVGRIDIIAVAHGRIVPTGQTKVVQAYERAIVRRVRVSDGMRVRQGQVLIDLDDAELAAEQERRQARLAEVRLAAARARAMLDFVERGAVASGSAASEAEVPAALRESSDRLLNAERQAYRREAEASQAAVQHLVAQRATAIEVLAKQKSLYPWLEQRTADMGRLAEQHHVARHDYLEQENRRLEMKRDMEIQRQRLEEIDAMMVKQQRDRQAEIADVMKRLRETLLQAEQEADQLRAVEAGLASRRDHMVLRAPVDGTVQQLAIHTEGGVVTEAQPLLVVVPVEAPLEITASIGNSDIGFVRKGQEAVVKVEAFPFTRFGTLRGVVEDVSPDAVTDERKGLFYQARLRLDKSWIGVEGQRVSLVPGMAVRVEIRTGRRRVIDYFLEPVRQFASESARER
ncbi:MAG TPA: HlyD family type I secretion periplasmic adaptor subunit [Moraxellaceae bacterium]|nr:HlyD family type I secretion periplasmic adaptor subunit [Moraxellaceae bacterium]